MHLTLNQIVNRIQSLAQNHKQIKYFRYDDIMQVMNSGDIIYPACFLDLDTATMDRSKRMTIYKFRIWLCDINDLSKDARSNINEVESDLMLMAEDMFAMINSTLLQEDWEPDEVCQVNIVDEEFQDHVVAVYFDINIGTEYVLDRCAVPNKLNTYVEQ